MIPDFAFSMLEFLIGLRNPHNDEEVKKYHTKMLRKKVKKAYKTPYYHKIIDKRMNELGINNFKEFIKMIKSPEDFQSLIPITERSELEKHSKEMTLKPLEKLIDTHTSGTTTNRSVSYFLSKRDIAVVGLSFIELYSKAGLKRTDKIAIVLPHTSSLSNADGKLQVVFPNAKFFDLENIKEEDIKEIVTYDGIHSYTNIPAQLFRKYEKIISELKSNGEINIKAIIGGGDFLAPGVKSEVKRILGREVMFANQYGGVESQGLTYVCKNENTHVISKYYFIELRQLPREYFDSRINDLAVLAESFGLNKTSSKIKELIGRDLEEIINELGNINNNELKKQINDVRDNFIKAKKGLIGELLTTNLFSNGMTLLRYPTGDVVELINCDCDDKINQPIRMIGRVKGLKKHVDVNSIINIVHQSNSYKEGMISGKGYIEYEMGELKPIINIYLEKGPGFINNDLVINDFKRTINNSDEYALMVGAGGAWSIWELRIHLIDEYKPVKWRVIIK